MTATAMAETMSPKLLEVRERAKRNPQAPLRPPLLPPGTSWMQGAAGIAAFLLRLARVLENGLDTPVIDRPDQWWAIPARLRTVHGAPR